MSKPRFPPLGLSLLEEHTECEDTGQNPHRATMLSNSSKEESICSLSPQMKLHIQLHHDCLAPARAGVSQP